MGMDKADAIRRSWETNAAAWIEAVRGGRIESRRLVTDRAVWESVMEAAPDRVLDVGCGEGWLCRLLAKQGIGTVGVDASRALIDAAKGQGDEYHCFEYGELVAADPLGLFDVAVCNFALLDEDLDPVLGGVRRRLRPTGVLIVQTVHPASVCGNGPCRDGWRTEDFGAMGPGFTEAMPWYFRTFDSWRETLDRGGWEITAMHEPAHPDSGVPLSLLMRASPR